MQEIVQTHLPLLAWRGNKGSLRLIYDDAVIGDIQFDQNGKASARYRDRHWTIQQASRTSSFLREKGSATPLGRMELQAPSPAGVEEGWIVIEGETYNCLRNLSKIPPKVTLTGSGGQPLLQLRQEDEEHGVIQIDNQSAAASPHFEMLVFWGLYLYFSATQESIASETESQQTPPAPPRDEKITGGPKDDEGGSVMPLVGVLLAGFGVYQFIRLMKRKV